MKWVYMKGISIEAQYLYRKALELARQERHEEALRYFRQAVVIAPVYAKAVCGMACCHARLRHYDEAIRLCDRALALDPALVEARVMRDRVVTTRNLVENPVAGAEACLMMQ